MTKIFLKCCTFVVLLLVLLIVCPNLVSMADWLAVGLGIALVIVGAIVEGKLAGSIHKDVICYLERKTLEENERG